jgi:hypothetical protein
LSAVAIDGQGVASRVNKSCATARAKDRSSDTRTIGSESRRQD